MSGITYKNITGTSETRIAMKFACSDTVPCTYIILNNINLKREDGDEEMYCNNAWGFVYGHVHPSATCFSSPSALHEGKEEDEEEVIAKSGTGRIIREEL